MKESDLTYLTGLVIRAKADDAQAFAEIYSLTYQKVYNYARHYMRDDYLAQDALQEIYIDVYNNLNKLEDPSLFIAWLNRISFNACFDLTKKNKTDVLEFSDPDTFAEIVDESFGNDPANNVQYQDELRRLKDAIEKLPFNEKQVIVMKFFNNMKLEEIAAALDISRSTVKRYVANGTETLKKLMLG